ncbi:hypothetical protein, partial [Robbsia andropogonis]|uniref:hypothetical protein n=1 Tax=Robbsia andropogonis TaxID=28092 RepID=UPI001C9050D0
ILHDGRDVAPATRSAVPPSFIGSYFYFKMALFKRAIADYIAHQSVPTCFFVMRRPLPSSASTRS